ncbi:MAG: sigma-70 family RNA polymerase sigma factor [Candidatus Limnocylindrales bacterium]
MQETTIAESTVRSAAAGDEAAFARLVAEHHARMARVAYVITGDPDTARDAVQAAWSIAWRKLKNLRDPAQAAAWLVSVAANEARQAVRHRQRRTVVEISAAVDRSTDRGDPADVIEVIDLRRILDALPADDRRLLALRYTAGLDSNALAAQLGISASGVRTRLARLLDRIRMDLDHA